MKKTNGLTLIELLVTIAVIAITLSIALPSYKSVTDNMAISNVNQQLESSLRFARSEAMKRHQNITVTQKSNNWKNGWEVKTTAGTPDTLKNTSLDGKILVTTDIVNTATISFSPDGSSTAIKYTISPANSTRFKTVQVSVLGRIKASI